MSQDQDSGGHEAAGGSGAVPQMRVPFRRRWRGRLGPASMALAGAGLVAAATAVIVSCGQTPEGAGVESVAARQQALTSAGPGSPPIVRGYLAVRVGGTSDNLAVVGAAGGDDVYLAGVTAMLRDLSTGITVAATTTDLSGRFNFPPQPEGRYQLCWQSKTLPAGCASAAFAVAGRLVHLGTVRVPLLKQSGYVSVWGKVTLGNGDRARFLEPVGNANAFARVSLIGPTGSTLDRVSVNNFGDYFLPRVPVAQALKLRAICEASTAEQAIAPGANLGGAAQHRIDLRFADRPPRLAELTARDAAGVRVRVAAPGSTVKLHAEAEDPDGDPVKLRWLLPDGNGALSDPTAPDVDWKLPAQAGEYTVSVMAYDGRGGYAESTLGLSAHDKGVRFAGHVAGTDTANVAGADVTINGLPTTTDGNGNFSLFAPETDRFVLRIHKRGYAMYSKIYDDGIGNGHWTLTRSSVAMVDPTLPIDVTNDRRPADCPGSFSKRFDWAKNPLLATAQWQDGKNNVIPAPKEARSLPLPGRDKPSRDQGCGPGARVQIPANGLVDAAGNLPTGPVAVEVSTVDLGSPEQMPGDETVDMLNGTSKVMQSFGAGIFEFWSGGTRLNLRPGVEALVSIPVDATQIAAGGPPPASIPLLYYDEKRGLWYPEGQMVLAGSVYQAKVKHFSAINADDTKTDQSCLDVHSPLLPPTYHIEVTIPEGTGQAPKVRSYAIDNASPSRHVIYNLPSNTNVILVPYDDTTNVPFGVFVVNTGGPQNPTSPNLPVNYDSCSTDVTLAPVTLPQDPLSGEFLHGLYSFAATNLTELNPAVPADNALLTATQQATADYYAQVDPRNKRLTFADFRNTNGFPAGEVRGVYANGGDLGFGRDMHCVKNGADVACYVTNYGNNTTDDQADADAALAGLAPVATVAMEFAKVEDPPGSPTEYSDPEQVVKFFVYDGSGNKVTAANLDGKGLRPVPQLCMVCHGGEYPGGITTGVPSFASRDDVKLGSVFLPFDLHYYKFPSAAGWDKATQQAAFKQLNQVMVLGSNPTPAIQDVIAGMYAGGPTQDEGFAVSGWSAQPAQQAMYSNVVAHTCRTCHAAISAADLRFETAGQMTDRLGAVETRVCQQHVMPHSLVTHNLFWESINPNMVGQLQSFGDTYKTAVNGWVGNKCGVFTAGGTTPVSPFTSTVQPIFDSNCTACHVGSSPPASLNLSAGVSYANLVNVASSELPSMSRIKPSDTSHSYLLFKVKGTQGSVGGSGSQMPLGGPALSSGQIGDIETWVNGGAAP